MIKKGIIGLGLLLLIGVVSQTVSARGTETVEAARALYRQGVDAFQSGDLATAESLLRRSVTTYRKDPRPWYFLAVIRFRQGDMSEAGTLASRAAQIETGHMPRMVDIPIPLKIATAAGPRSGRRPADANAFSRIAAWRGDINGSLEFVQGEERRFLEQYREEMRQKRAEALAIWYEQRYIRGDWPGVVRRRVGDIEDSGNRAKLAAVLAEIDRVTGIAGADSVEAIAEIARLEKVRESIRQNACIEWNQVAEQTSKTVLEKNTWPGLDLALGVDPATIVETQPAATVPSDVDEFGAENAEGASDEFGDFTEDEAQDEADPFGDSEDESQEDPFAE